ncbi:MAG: SurA N-terminal domain-containing protein [Paracoccaceae bacterium]
MTKSKTSVSKIFVWILLGFLFVGLVGFGAGNLSGNIKTIGKIGETDITVNQYVRALQTELRNTSQQFGQQLTLQQLQAFGIQQRVLARLVTDKLLENEAYKLSLSVDDKTVRDKIVSLNAFKGPDGNFNQDAYNYTLENAGYTSAEFEEEIRAETARNILSQSILSGNMINKLQAEILASFLLEERSFNIQILKPENFSFTVKDPSNEQLKSFLETNIDDYTVPESKAITYAVLKPEMLIDIVESDDSILEKIYDEKKQKYNKPEQRTVERLSFLNMDEANSVMAEVTKSLTDFDKLLSDRNLSDEDVLYGTFTEEQLLEGKKQVFAGNLGEVVGPVETDLGPVIFRIREIIPAKTTSFEEAKPELDKEYKLSEAIKLIDERIEDSQNLLAAGGTLEELNKEIGFSVENILFNSEANVPILENKIFFDTAQTAKVNDFPEIKELPNGGLFALRVDQTVDARQKNIDEVRTELTNAWQKQEIQNKLDEIAKDMLSKHQYKGKILNFNKITRDKDLPELPENIVEEAFNLSTGEGTVISGDEESFILRLKNVSNADLSSDTAKLLISQLKNQISNSLSADLFESFANMARVNSKLDLNEQAVNAVHSSFQ